MWLPAVSCTLSWLHFADQALHLRRGADRQRIIDTNSSKVQRNTTPLHMSLMQSCTYMYIHSQHFHTFHNFLQILHQATPPFQFCLLLPLMGIPAMQREKSAYHLQMRSRGMVSGPDMVLLPHPTWIGRPLSQRWLTHYDSVHTLHNTRPCYLAAH